MVELEVRVMLFGDGGRGQEPGHVGSLYSWTRQGNQLSSEASRMKEGLPTSSFEASDLWNHKRINLCSKPLSLW